MLRRAASQRPNVQAAERLLRRDSTVRVGSFTPIRTEAPAGGSTAYRGPSRLDGRCAPQRPPVRIARAAAVGHLQTFEGVGRRSGTVKTSCIDLPHLKRRGLRLGFFNLRRRAEIEGGRSIHDVLTGAAIQPAPVSDSHRPGPDVYECKSYFREIPCHFICTKPLARVRSRFR